MTEEFQLSETGALAIALLLHCVPTIGLSADPYACSEARRDSIEKVNVILSVIAFAINLMCTVFLDFRKSNPILCHAVGRLVS